MTRRKWYYHDPISIILCLSLFILQYSYIVDGIKCYCTDDKCVPYGSCEDTVCLVGILRESNQVIRTCGSTSLGCHRNQDDKWTDLCACDQPFCNTFAFLRSHTRRLASTSSPSSSSMQHHHIYDSSRHDDTRIPPPPGRSNSFGGSDGVGQVHHDAPLVFNRMDRPDDGIPPPPPGLMEREGANKTSLLTLLLVVVPLTVGAATVMVVAFNYYCHLC